MLVKHLGLSSCVPALIVMKGHEAWIMYDGAELTIILIRHIFGTLRSHHWLWRVLGGHRGYHFLGIQILPKSEGYK